MRRSSLQWLDTDEVKTSRADNLGESKHSLRRRIGMRYSNEFYFVTPANLVKPAEIPAECGLVEAGVATPEEWRELMPRQAGFSYEADTQAYCLITVPAPWRDTPGPTELVERPPAPVAQQKLEFS